MSSRTEITTNGSTAASDLRVIHLAYNNADSETSAMRLVLSVHPEWEGSDGPIEVSRFTDGITNTVRVECPRSFLTMLTNWL